MPSSVGPNTFGEENLVFGYDLGDVRNSYKGKPTTNFIANLGDPTEERARGEFGQYFNLVPIFETYGLVPYTLSMEIKGNIPGYCLVYMQNGSYTKYGFVSAAVEITTEWQRFVFPNITPSGPTAAWQANTPGDNRAMLATYTIYGSGRNPTIRNVQLELGSYATPFTPSARSATQGLLDLTGNSTINIANVSFDSNGRMTFDGTNDQFFINIDNWIRNVTDITVEGVVEIPSGVSLAGAPWGILTDHAVNSEKDGFWWHMSLGGGYTYFRVEDNVNGEIGITFSNPTTFAAGNTYHIVTVVGSAGVAIYNNGVKVESYSPSFSWANISASQIASLVIGSTYPNYYLNSVTHTVKLYNRALSADEVQRNFNAVKSRFNIA